MDMLKFIINNKFNFKRHICGCYLLSECFIENNQDELNWDYLSINEKLPWSINLIDKFNDRWNWKWLSGNEKLPWTDELIIKFSDRWIWNYEDTEGSCLLRNDAIEWSKNVIHRYPDKFPGEWLATKTELLNNHLEILEDFKDKLWWDYISGNEYMNWSEELIDRYIDYWNWDILSANEAIRWNRVNREKYKGRFNIESHHRGSSEMFINKRIVENNAFMNSEVECTRVLYTPEEFELRRRLNPPGHLSLDERVPWSDELIEKWKHEWNWGSLSLNENLPWSESLIEKYVERWNWENLSVNRSLPWTEKLIEKFVDRWDFGTNKVSPYDDAVQYCTSGLSSNPKLPWSMDFIKKYESRWTWSSLSYSEEIQWSIEILQEFEQKWDWDEIVWNETMWKKVFYPYLDEEIVAALFTIMKIKWEPLIKEIPNLSPNK
jgi:hypothetical protein